MVVFGWIIKHLTEKFTAGRCHLKKWELCSLSPKFLCVQKIAQYMTFLFAFLRKFWISYIFNVMCVCVRACVQCDVRSCGLLDICTPKPG
jgi:hypothetical protein